MGLSDPLKGTLWLHKCLKDIHIQSNPASCKLAFMYKPAHTGPSPAQVPHTASIMGHPDHGPLWFPLDGQIYSGSWKASTQHSTYVFRMWLLALPPRQRYSNVTIHLKVRKTDPFGQENQHNHLLLWHPSLQCLCCLGPHLVPPGNTSLPQWHHCSSYLASHSPGMWWWVTSKAC